MLQFTADSGTLTFRISGSTKLPEVACSLQFGIAWALGSGIYRFQVTKDKASVPDTSKYRYLGMQLEIKPLATPKPLLFSMVSNLNGLWTEKYFPSRLENNEKLTNAMEYQAASDGQNRLRSSRDGTVLVRPKLLRQITLNEYCFGLADTIVGFFVMGAGVVRYAGSMEEDQIYFNKGMSERDLAEYVKDPICYDSKMTVSDLWR